MFVRGNMDRMSNHHFDSSRDVPLRKWTRSAAVKAKLNGCPVTSSASDTSTTRFMSMIACGTVSGCNDATGSTSITSDAKRRFLLADPRPRFQLKGSKQ